jgi:hypothetical protein
LLCRLYNTLCTSGYDLTFTLWKHSNPFSHTIEKRYLDPQLLNGSSLRKTPTRAVDRSIWRAFKRTILLMLILASPIWVYNIWNKPKSRSRFNDYRDLLRSTKLVWHPCFDEFLCAKFQVPMNQDTATAPDDNSIPLVEIAFIMVGFIEIRRSGENFRRSMYRPASWPQPSSKQQPLNQHFERKPCWPRNRWSKIYQTNRLLDLIFHW